MKKFSPIMIVHLVLMIAMILCSVFAVGNFVVGASQAATGMERFDNLTHVLMMLVILAMLIVGTLYLLNNYGKQAAKYYKAFLLLHVVVCILTIFVNLCFSAINAFLISVSILYVVRTIVLLILAFGKDLGRKNTWLLFYVLLASGVGALILALFYMAANGFDFSFMGYITAVIADGTLGLAIRGKYQDKAVRGRD